MTKKDVCEVEYVNKRSVQRVKSKMLHEKIILRVTDNFKILGDSTRIKILFALSQKELCVCDLSVLLKMTQSAISHQLRLLRNFNLVKFRKKGKIVYYSLSDEQDRKSTRLNSSHTDISRMPSSA